MHQLFASMVQRAHSSYTKRPKPFLQYVLMGRGMEAKTYLSELLFAESNQGALDACLKTGFSAPMFPSSTRQPRASSSR